MDLGVIGGAPPWPTSPLATSVLPSPAAAAHARMEAGSRALPPPCLSWPPGGPPAPSAVAAAVAAAAAAAAAIQAAAGLAAMAAAASPSGATGAAAAAATRRLELAEVLGHQVIPEPEVGSADCPTVGSEAHRTGTCKPCAFLYTKGCMNGVECTFCHLCDEGEKKRRQKERKEHKRRLFRWTDPEQALGG